MRIDSKEMLKNAAGARLVASGPAAVEVVKTYVRNPQRRLAGGKEYARTGARYGKKLYLGSDGYEDVYLEDDKVYARKNWADDLVKDAGIAAITQSKILFEIAKWETEFICNLTSAVISLAAGGVKLIAFYEVNQKTVNEMLASAAEVVRALQDLRRCSPTLHYKLSTSYKTETWERAKKLLFRNVGEHVEIMDSAEALEFLADIVGGALAEAARAAGTGGAGRSGVVALLKTMLVDLLKAVRDATASKALKELTRARSGTGGLRSAAAASGSSGPKEVKKGLEAAGVPVTEKEATAIFLEINGRQSEATRVLDSLTKNASDLISALGALQTAWAAMS